MPGAGANHYPHAVCGSGQVWGLCRADSQGLEIGL